MEACAISWRVRRIGHSSKNTYLMTSERLAQEVLMTVGRGIVNDHLACDKKVPEKWLDEKSDFLT